ncbi:MAG: 4Fe-4S binding protein [Dehalococcoidia bacterium]|nr:4Fe-4S binding protein [Dehalococcoidia bacterium]
MANTTVSHRVILHFPSRVVNQPVISNFIKNYDLSFNIMKASIIPDQEGYVMLELSGDQDKYNAGISYLHDAGVRIEPFSQNVQRSDERCVQCGACVGFCPTEAFHLDGVARAVVFNNNLCVACGLCLTACPARAMQLRF